MDPRIIAVSGPLKDQVFRLADGGVSVGREPSNRVPVRDVTVSRRHCVIEMHDGQVQVTDLGSHNGTLVNGIPVNKRALRHGDVLRVGQSELLFVTEADVPELAPRVLYGNETTTDILKTVKIRDSRTPLPSELGRMARDLSGLVKISRTINSTRDPQELQRKLLECIFEVIPADFGAILLMDQAEDEPTSICSYDREGRDGRQVTVSRELVQRTLWEQSAVIAEDAAGSEAAGNALCAALVGVQRTIGVLYLASSGSQRKFEEDHVGFLNSVAGIAAVTLENVLALESLRAENRRLRAELDPDNDIVGDGKAMKHLAGMIGKIAQGDSTVLILGESGTGKELVARAIHAASARSDKPFMAINCAAIPDALLESELFGHEKGSFTGAIATKKGKLEVAEDGTILLDEIGEMPPPCRPSCCASCSSASSNASEARARSSCMLACWPRPTKTSRRRSRAASFARTCSTA